MVLAGQRARGKPRHDRRDHVGRGHAVVLDRAQERAENEARQNNNGGPRLRWVSSAIFGGPVAPLDDARKATSSAPSRAA